jgi:hypothetical protein
MIIFEIAHLSASAFMPPSRKIWMHRKLRFDERLVEHLERADYVVMQEPAPSDNAAGHKTLAGGVSTVQRLKPKFRRRRSGGGKGHEHAMLAHAYQQAGVFRPCPGRTVAIPVRSILPGAAPARRRHP